MRRTPLTNDPLARARVEALFIVSILVMGVMIVVLSATGSVTRGLDEGQLPPDFTAPSHEFGTPPSTWTDYRLYDHFNADWEEGENGSWMLLQFIDTDCPFCWEEGETMSYAHIQYKHLVDFISIAIEISSIGGHESSRSEIVAFQEQSPRDGCRAGSIEGPANCAERPGQPHEFLYIDDLNQNVADSWKVTGTPTFFILQPDGKVAWNSQNHKGVTVDQALQSTVGGV